MKSGKHPHRGQRGAFSITDRIQIVDDFFSEGGKEAWRAKARSHCSFLQTVAHVAKASRKVVSIKWHCSNPPSSLICRPLHPPAQQGLYGQEAWACSVGRWQAQTESQFVKLNSAVGAGKS